MNLFLLTRTDLVTIGRDCGGAWRCNTVLRHGFHRGLLFALGVRIVPNASAGAALAPMCAPARPLVLVSVLVPTTTIARHFPPTLLVTLGCLHNPPACGACRVARRFPARGWVLAEQACNARGSPFPRPFLQRPLGYGRHRCYCPCGGRVDVTPALGRAVIAGERVPSRGAALRSH